MSKQFNKRINALTDSLLEHATKELETFRRESTLEENQLTEGLTKNVLGAIKKFKREATKVSKDMHLSREKSVFEYFPIPDMTLEKQQRIYAGDIDIQRMMARQRQTILEDAEKLLRGIDTVTMEPSHYEFSKEMVEWYHKSVHNFDGIDSWLVGDLEPETVVRLVYGENFKQTAAYLADYEHVPAPYAQFRSAKNALKGAGTYVNWKSAVVRNGRH